MQLIRTKSRIWILSALAFISTFGCRTCLAHDATAHRLIRQAVVAYRAVQNYTCRLDKRVRKNGVLHEDLDILVKYKKPRNYYFRWMHGKAKGREVIFVAGEHQDKLVAHPGGLLRFLTFYLDPQGPLAMQANRHSLRDSGMEKIVAIMETNEKLALDRGLDALRLISEDKLGRTDMWVIEGTFPPGQGYYAHRVIICMSRSLQLPVKISIFDWSNELIEEYTFRNLSINVGLTEDDFDPGNPEYDYLISQRR